MKALILAAGIGSRLAPLTDTIPKSLVSVNNKPILVKQIENLYENRIFDITIVSGYKADILKKSIHELFPDIKIIESVDYVNTNNMYSAYIGLNSMFRNGISESFLMMNADVFIDSSVISTLIDFSFENAVVTDIGNYLEESMKVIEENNRLIEISKNIAPDKAKGCSIDVYKFGVDGGAAFWDMCRKYIEELHEMKLWSEVALNDAFNLIEFKACPLSGRWIEIDNMDDLIAAEKIFI